MRRRSRPFAALAVLALLAAAGCGAEATPAAGPPPSPVSSGDARSLAGVCPPTVVVQTSWYPDITYGHLYQMLGAGYTVDARRKLVRGRLVAGGVETGVQLEVRAGGPALAFQPVATLMKQDPTIMLGQQATEEQVQAAGIGRTVSVFAPLEKDPVVFAWDPARHPDWKTVRDIGRSDATVLSYESASGRYLVAAGVLKAKQVDFSFDGSPARFVVSAGEIAVGGFSTGEPFTYPRLPSWHKPVAYGYVADAGYPSYRNLITVRAADRQKLSGCLQRLVPVMQRAEVDFIRDPAAASAVVRRLGTEFRSPSALLPGQAEFGLRVMRDDGLVSNGSDGTLGDVDAARVQRLITALAPVFKGAAAGLRPADLSTNEFLDSSIGLPAGTK